MTNVVAVDTGVFSAPLARRSSALTAPYAPHLQGRRLVLAAQTVADLRFGALVAGWGPARMSELDRRISMARVAPVEDELLWTHARLRVACRAAGHPLADRIHAADLWVESTAVRYRIPLVAHDTVFRNVPGLALITELPD